jgi:hypothetical protein
MLRMFKNGVKEAWIDDRRLKKLRIEKLEFHNFYFQLTFSILPTEGSCYKQNVLCDSFNPYPANVENRVSY